MSTDVPGTRLPDLNDKIRAAAHRSEVQRYQQHSPPPTDTTVVNIIPLAEQKSSIAKPNYESKTTRKSRDTNRKSHKDKAPAHTHQISTTLTDAEYDVYQTLVDASGLSKSAYLRIIATTPDKVTIRALTDIDTDTLAALLQCAEYLSEMRDTIRNISCATNHITANDIALLREYHESLRTLARRIYQSLEVVYGHN